MYRFKRITKSFVSAAFTVLMTVSVFSLLGTLTGIDSGSLYAYALSRVTVGEYTWDGVSAVNNKIVMDPVDLAENDSSSFLVGIQASMDDGLVNLINDNVRIDNESPATGVFSINNVNGNLNQNVSYFTVHFDASDLDAGTYTADITVDLGGKVTANGYTCGSDNRLRIPVSVTVTGENPSHQASAQEPKVTSLAATPGNEYNEVSWVEAEGCISYSVFRRDGKDSNPLDPELDKYKHLGIVYTVPDYYYHEEGYDDAVFVDHYVENGKEYSYIVIAGGSNDAFSGEPSKSVSAKPGAGKRKKPAAPFRTEAYAGETEGGVTWYWDNRGGHHDPDNYYASPENSDGEGLVDHFNVYVNDRLYKQVKQNAPGEGAWSASIKFPVQNADYTIRVTAVDPEGNESVPGNYAVISPESDQDVRIDKHLAYYYDDEEMWDDDTDSYVTYTGLAIGLYGVRTERYDIWKKPAGSPDSTYQKADLPEFDKHYEANYEFFFDENVTEGKAYTYKVIGHAPDGRVSEQYVFSVAACYDDIFSNAPGGSNMDLSLRSSGGESAVLHLFYYGEGTYRLYRDGAVINTWTNCTDAIQYTDTPSVDGNYSYHMTWTSKAIPSLNVKSNTVIFCRDTSEVDPDELEKAPGAPRLTGRIKDPDSGAVTMSWNPDKNGGKPDGYIIYRTDDGCPNTFMWNNTAFHPLQEEPANGRYISIDAGRTSYDMYIAWSESHYNHTSGDDFRSPHNLWVVAYNELGISEPSNVLVYSDVDGGPPQIADTAAPGAPESVSAWCEWTDTNGYESGLTGKLYVSWAEPTEGESVRQYKITCAGDDGSDPVVRTTAPGSGYTNPYDINLGGDIECGVTYSVTVSAVNDAGEAVSAPPVIITPENSLAFTATANGGRSIALQWTALKDEYDDVVDEYQIWRRADMSQWTQTETVPGNAETSHRLFKYTDSGLSPGTEYEYYIIAKEKNGKLHKSVIRNVITSSRSDSASAPTGFSAEATPDGDVLLHWTPPADGGLPTGYKLEYQTTDMDPASDYQWRSVDLEDTFGNSTGAAIMSWQYDGGHTSGQYAVFSGLYGKTLRMRVRANVYGHGVGESSNYIEFTWPASPGAERDSPPGPIRPTAEPGDGKITIRWTKRTELEPGEGEATFYQLVRSWGDNYRVIFTIPAVDGQTEYEYVDDDTDIVNGRTYTYELRPCNSFYAMDQYYNEYWYSPLCYMYYVTATPNGQTTDQKIAGNVVSFADELIADKPDDLSTMTDEYRRKVYELKDNYDNLTSYQKKLIGSDKCAEIENFINEIVNYDIQDAYQDDARLTAVLAEIGVLKDASQITADTLTADEAAVKSAREHYNALPEDAKTLVNNYSRLTDAEAKIKQLRREASDTEAAAAVSAKLEAIDLDMINGLDYDSLTDEIELDIADLRWEYNSLTKAQKAKVTETGLNKLIQAEDKINTILGVGHIHDMKAVSEKAPTCSEPGHARYYTCRKCGRNFTDAEGNFEIADMETIAVPADPGMHDWTSWAVKEGHDATCTTGGIEERECSICHKHEERSFEARDHSWNNGEITTEASSDEDGIVTFTCTACGATRTARITYSEGSCPDMDEHVWGEGVETAAATCRSSGMIEYECTKCHASIKYETTIDPLAHDWSEWAPVAGHEATCMENGTSERYCRNEGCTERETRVDEAQGHNWKPVDGDDTEYEPATCAQTGRRTVECSVCHERRPEIIPALKTHDWGDWEVRTEPTCTEVGLEERVCRTSDEHREFRPVAPLGHSWDNGTVTKAATTSATGIKTFKCKRAGCKETRTEVIPKLPAPKKASAPKKAAAAKKSAAYAANGNAYIDPKLPKVKIKGPKKGKKSFTAKWKKLNKKKQQKLLKGIEIEYSLTRDFKNPKFKKVSKKKASVKIKKLKSGKTYYVRAHTYIYRGKVKYVSYWSKTKKVKVK